MPPLGMLKLQVLFALLQLLRKTLLILLPESHKMLDLEEAVRGHWALQNGIFGAVLSAPWGEVCAQQFCISLNGFVYKLVCFM